MSEFVKSQFALAATTLTDIYTCPTGRKVNVVLYLCNRGGSTTFRISIAKNGAGNTNSQYIYYDTVIAANATLRETFPLNEGDVIRAYAGSADLSVNTFPDSSDEIALI